jgi:hypothetical protein
MVTNNMKSTILITIVSLFLAACSPTAPSDTAAHERRIKELETEVASLRAQLTKAATPATSQELTGLYLGSDSVFGLPTQIEFTAPGICQMRFGNGNGVFATATYENKSGGILFDTKIGGVFFAKRVGNSLQITQGGHTVDYAKQ